MMRIAVAAAVVAAALAHQAHAHTQECRASYYGKRFDDRPTASGELFDMTKMTAAHRSLPFGTRVRVESLATGRAVTVRINDRGPFVRGRCIDLSRRAAERLGIILRGVAPVRLTW